MQRTIARTKMVSVLVAMFMMISAVAADTRVPTPPLEQRVKGAELVFVGKLIDKNVEGDWARAKLQVEVPLKGVEQEQAVEVIWRVRVGERPVYDVPEGKQGVALLGDKHEGRYWLRGDKFEDLSKLDKIKKILKKED